MARFDLYARDGNGFLLDVQTDLLSEFSTRIVVPLMPEASVPPPTKRLHPDFEIAGRKYVMATHLMSAVPIKDLGHPSGNLKAHSDQIAAALDMILLGY